MGKEEFITKAKELGYTEEMIHEIINNHEQAAGKGINIPYEIELENLPVENK
jgi:hypothetical protein